MRTDGQMDMKFGRFSRLFERAYLRADHSAERFNPGEVAPTHYLYEVAWGIS